MRFYRKKHAFTCGVDLHIRTMFLCILDQAGAPILHKNMPSTPAAFLKAARPFREDLAVGVECIFTWYWLADLYREEGILFILGHSRSSQAAPVNRAHPWLPVPTHFSPWLSNSARFRRTARARVSRAAPRSRR